MPLDDFGDKSAQEALTDLIGKVGENVVVRALPAPSVSHRPAQHACVGAQLSRVHALSVPAGSVGAVGVYVHNSRIGCISLVSGTNPEHVGPIQLLARQIAQQASPC
jgi:translation elongation factor EF-Ts